MKSTGSIEPFFSFKSREFSINFKIKMSALGPFGLVPSHQKDCIVPTVRQARAVIILLDASVKSMPDLLFVPTSFRHGNNLA